MVEFTMNDRIEFTKHVRRLTDCPLIDAHKATKAFWEVLDDLCTLERKKERISKEISDLASDPFMGYYQGLKLKELADKISQL